MINRNIYEEQDEIRRLSNDDLGRQAQAGGGMTGILSAMELSRRAQMNRRAAQAMVAQRHNGGTVLSELSQEASRYAGPPQPMNMGSQGYNTGGVVQPMPNGGISSYNQGTGYPSYQATAARSTYWNDDKKRELNILANRLSEIGNNGLTGQAIDNEVGQITQRMQELEAARQQDNQSVGFLDRIKNAFTPYKEAPEFSAIRSQIDQWQRKKRNEGELDETDNRILESLPRRLTDVEASAYRSTEPQYRNEFLKGLPNIDWGDLRTNASYIEETGGWEYGDIDSTHPLTVSNKQTFGPKLSEPAPVEEEPTPSEGPNPFADDALSGIPDPEPEEQGPDKRESFARGLALLQAASRVANGNGNTLGNITAGLAEGGKSYQGHLDRTQAQENTEALRMLKERQLIEQQERRFLTEDEGRRDRTAQMERLKMQLAQSDRGDRLRAVASLTSAAQRELDSQIDAVSKMDDYTITQQYGDEATKAKIINLLTLQAIKRRRADLKFLDLLPEAEALESNR